MEVWFWCCGECGEALVMATEVDGVIQPPDSEEQSIIDRLCSENHDSRPLVKIFKSRNAIQEPE